MLNALLYVVSVLMELLVSIFAFLYFSSTIISDLKGAPFVPTKKKDMQNLLKAAGLKKGQIFLDIGSGDGRLVIEAAKQYGVKGIGIEINMFLNILARFKAWIQHVPSVEFKTENILKTDLSQADVIYHFLMPNIIKKLKPRLETETKKDVLIISHGFNVEEWDKYKFKTIEGQPFNTYYYRFH